MRVLFDQPTPVPIRRFLTGHSVRTAAQQQWAALKNGDLLTAAEEAGFEAFLTTDRNIRYQQDLASRSIAIVVIGVQQWPPSNRTSAASWRPWTRPHLGVTPRSRSRSDAPSRSTEAGRRW
jgi:hypothetical protein